MELLFFMKTVVFICYESNRAYLSVLFKNSHFYSLHIDTVESIKEIGIKQYIEEKVVAINTGKLVVDGITSSNDFGIMVASFIARLTNKIAPTMDSLLYCTNKYISRLLQQKVMPKNTPQFFLLSQQKKINNYNFSFPILINRFAHLFHTERIL